MRRFLRWIFVLLFLGCAGVTAWWAIHQFVLPRMVEQRLVAALQQIGLDGSAARVDKLGAERAVISNLIIGSEELITIDTAEITYSLDKAIEGRVNTVLLTGAWLRLSFKDGKLDLGQLGSISSPIAGSASAGSNDPDQPTDLAFDRIELRSSRITLDVGSMGLFIPISGSIERAEPGRLRVDLRGELFDRRLLVSGTLRATETGVAADDVRIHLSPGDVPVAAGAFTLIDTTVTLNCDAELNGKRLRVDLRDGSRLDTAGTAWRLKPHFARPLLDTGAPDAEGTSVAARFESVSPIVLQRADADVHIERAYGDIRADFSADHPMSVDGSAVIDGASVAHNPTGVRLENIRADVPISHRSPGAEPGVFTVGRIVVGDDVLPAIIGSTRLADGRLELNADWRFIDELSASVRLEADTEHLIAQVTIPPTEITRPAAIANALTPLREFDITGTVGLDASLWWQGGELAPDIALFADDLNIARSDVDVEITGISGEVRFDRVNPLSTSTNQRLDARSVRLGKLAFADAVATFQIESPQRVFVERVETRMASVNADGTPDGSASGRFYAHAMRFDLDHPVINTNLFIENLEVRDWLTLLAQDRVEATGRLYGRIPIRFDPDARAMLRLGDGYLFAESDDGTIKFRDASTVANLLAQHDPRFADGGQLEQQRRDVAEALADFHYDMFRFRIRRDPATGKAVAHLSTSGRGRTGAKRIVGSLNVNIAGDFEEAANLALFTQTALGDRIDRSLGTVLPGAGDPDSDASTDVPTDADFEQFFE